jgi:hypothetical protein
MAAAGSVTTGAEAAALEEDELELELELGENAL